MSDPIPSNELDRTIVAFTRSRAALPELMRQLSDAEELWFLMPYHPEMEGEAIELKPGMPLPFVEITDEKGALVPVFSSCERAEEAMTHAGFPQRKFVPAAMPALQLLGILGRAELRAALNKSCGTGQLILPPNLMRDIADGSALRLNSDPTEQVRDEVHALDPAEYPTDLVQAAFEILRQHRHFRTAWIFERGKGEPTPAGGRRYQFLVLMEPRDAVISRDLSLVVSSARSPADEVELGYLDENDAPLLAKLWQLAPPFYAGPDYGQSPDSGQ